jgi:hypothetical protein
MVGKAIAVSVLAIVRCKKSGPFTCAILVGSKNVMKKSNDNEYLFTLLDKLAEYDREELRASFSNENIESICTLAKCLLDEIVKPEALTPSGFIDLVYKLRKYKKEGARKLGDSLILADSMIKENNLAGAIAVLDNFIGACPSPFYRDIAEVQKNKYQEKI